MVVWAYRHEGQTRSDKTGDTMGQYGTGYGAATRADYGSAIGVDRDYRSAAGYGGTNAIGASGTSASRTSRTSGTSGTPVVSFVNVSKHYGSLKAVDGLSLDLRPGETTALLGPNGAGKSTSLDMLLALRKPTSGRISMFGEDPYHAVKSGRVGAMLQSGGLMPEVTVRELVTLVTGFHPRPEPVQTTLTRAGIAKFADQRVDRLSGGQTQRVRFALAICGKSELIVLDEPTAAMDVETRRLFWNSMKEEVAEGRTLLFATHYLEEADQAADRVLVINRGRLLADGTPAEIKARAGAKRLSFRLDTVDERFLLGLPGLVNLEVRHDLVQIQTSDSDATLYAVLDAGCRPHEIEVGSLGLEQAFIAITAEDDRANGDNGRNADNGGNADNGEAN
jgi:ABC-2 type transport system ATP-binding protein